jgi:glutaminyl-tRNA synthetase
MSPASPRKPEPPEPTVGKETPAPSNFIRTIVEQDCQTGKWDGRVATRFPPEPNGYLHIGHAKSICLNFGVAADFNGTCNLRFDDTNPLKENVEYVDSIKEDVRWLGFDWQDREYYASDYFQQLFDYAVQLIHKGLAYVDDLNADEIREYRGTLTEPGRESPWRNRPVEENLDLFRRMREGEFPDGSHVLRAKIDMASPNLLMRDPTLYRIRKAAHHRTGDAWCIYPMYDFTHCLSDSVERITHSVCTLEFENNRELYDWVLDRLEVYHPQQIEFARLNLTYTVLSKRKLIALVENGIVQGWDDPRMPTISDSLVDFALLEFCVREYLNRHAPRVMAVLDPLKVVIENWPKGRTEEMEAVNNPEDPDAGTRKVPFSGTLFIERDDFREDPPRKFFRLAPGREVRLRYAYFIRCRDVVKDPDTGEVVELRCTYDPETRGGDAPDGRKVKATLHWVSASHAADAEVRLYEHLFTEERPAEAEDFLTTVRPDSLRTVAAKVEPGLAGAERGSRWQFERLGYFCVDSVEGEGGRLVFNRTVTLRDTWAKIAKKTKMSG